MLCLYWLKFFVFDYLARMVWLHFCAWFVDSIDLMVSDLFSFTRARLWVCHKLWWWYENNPSIFFFRKYKFSYIEIYMYDGYILYKVEIFPHILQYQCTFSTFV